MNSGPRSISQTWAKLLPAFLATSSSDCLISLGTLIPGCHDIAAILTPHNRCLGAICACRWPGALVSWSCLLPGGFRDPLVGRDVECMLAAFAGTAQEGRKKLVHRLVQSTDFTLSRPINSCKNLLPCL